MRAVHCVRNVTYSTYVAYVRRVACGATVSTYRHVSYLAWVACIALVGNQALLSTPETMALRVIKCRRY